ncbi:AAA family ATPase [Flavobacterium humi]|uniref:AAA family ATPase n=1 Tax=Flavobacterium humi TaxID=2562683 RepID=UPI001B8D2388|nr:AAA family ATPase [Flavobacterium humi]
MKKRNPITILEDSFLSIKEYIEGEMNNEKTFFDQAFVQQLKKETLLLIQLCELLNQDEKFVKTINDWVNPNRANSFLFKAEHFFLSDIVSICERKTLGENEKSRFVYAYYYDALRNRHFADEKAISTLNKLVASTEFHENLKNIKKQSVIVPANSQQTNFLIPALSETAHARLSEMKMHFERFLQFSYSLDAASQNIVKAISEENKTLHQSVNSQVSYPPEDDTLEKVLEELHGLVGLEAVKKDISELINLLEIQKKRSAEGLKNIEIALHTVFLGPPGTGKTSVARLLSRIFKHLGFLSKGQMYETDREGMVAGFVGQTATKVDKAVQESLGGVLFIDEAYSLTQNNLGNDYGAEAVNTMLKRMEDHRDDLAVVVAGYTEPMKFFVETNPGLRSRFSRYFIFEHFKPSELFLIFETFCKKSDFILTEEAKEKLHDTFELLYSKKDEGFGNARVIRNLFEKCVQNQANRIVKLTKINQEILKTICEEDIPEPKETQEQVYFAVNNPSE